MSSMEIFGASYEAAIVRTRQILLPFRTWTWIKLFLLLTFSGTLGFNPIWGPGSKDQPTPTSNVQWDKSGPGGSVKSASIIDLEFADASLPDPLATFQGIDPSLQQKIKDFALANVALAVMLGVMIVVTFLIIVLFFAWLASRLMMVLLESLEQKSVQIRFFWRKTRALGQSLFRFQMVIFAASLAGGLALMGIAILSVIYMFHSGFNLAGFLGLWGAVLMFALAGLGVVFLWFLHRFLPIVMRYCQENASAAFQRLMHWLKGSPLQVAAFLGLYTLMVLAIFVGLMIISVVYALVVVWLAKAGGNAVGVILILVGAILGMLTSTVVSTFCTYLRMELVQRSMN